MKKKESLQPNHEKPANLLSRTYKPLKLFFEMWVRRRSYCVVRTGSCFWRGRQCPYFTFVTNWQRSVRKSEKISRTAVPVIDGSEPLIHADINKPSSNVMLCSNASLTGEVTLPRRSERFHDLQRSLVSKAYNALQNEANIPDVAQNLISKCTCRCEKLINVLEVRAVLPEIR